MAALFDAHARLSTCRNMNGEIPWTAIDRWADRHGIDDVAFLEDVIYGFERVRTALAKAKEQANAPSESESVH